LSDAARISTGYSWSAGLAGLARLALVNRHILRYVHEHPLLVVLQPEVGIHRFALSFRGNANDGSVAVSRRIGGEQMRERIIGYIVVIVVVVIVRCLRRARYAPWPSLATLVAGSRLALSLAA
jgi:hypothetical protein